MIIFRKYTQLSAQLLILTVSKIFFLPFVRRNKEPILPNKLQKGPRIIIANHRRGLDPFIIMAALPYKSFLKIAPVNFMTHNAFYDSALRPMAWLAGCYPARNPKGKHTYYGIDGSVSLLRNGFSVMIFPEGTRVRNAERGPAKPGVIVIHQQAPLVPFLLARITYAHRPWRIHIAYQTIERPHFSDAEKIMDKVFMLH